MDALEVLENLEQVNITLIAADALNESKAEFIALNREQLMEGKTLTGEDLLPTYLEDPFFKSKESAQKYSDWKDAITPNPKRKKGVPNLFITGPFHQSIGMEVLKGDEYEVFAEYKDADSIVAKFTDNILGLNEEKREKLIDEKLEETFYDKAHDATGL